MNLPTLTNSFGPFLDQKLQLHTNLSFASLTQSTLVALNSLEALSAVDLGKKLYVSVFDLVVFLQREVRPVRAFFSCGEMRWWRR